MININFNNLSILSSSERVPMEDVLRSGEDRNRKLVTDLISFIFQKVSEELKTHHLFNFFYNNLDNYLYQNYYLIIIPRLFIIHSYITDNSFSNTSKFTGLFFVKNCHFSSRYLPLVLFSFL